MNKMGLLLCWVVIGVAAGAFAQPPVGEAEALSILLRKQILAAPEAKRPHFEPVEASIFVRPYAGSDSSREKQARTAWYHAQLPPGFPTSGKLRVLYLPRCMFGRAYDYDWAPGLEADASQAGDREWIRIALEAEGGPGLDLSGIARTDGFQGRSSPVPALESINLALVQAWKAGRTPTLLAVFEPYCGPSDRRYDGPSPPPPPPPPAPFYIERRPGTALYIASEFQSDLCEIRTGSRFDLSCRGWRTISANPVVATGSRYRYVARRAGQPDVRGEFRVGYENESPDHPLHIDQP